jgi:hypothetical protein
LTAWLASFHTNRPADILSSKLSHQPRPQLTSRRSGLSHQPQVGPCSRIWPYSLSQLPCSLSPARVEVPALEAAPCQCNRKRRVPAAMPLRAPSPQASHMTRLAANRRSPIRSPEESINPLVTARSLACHPETTFFCSRIRSNGFPPTLGAAPCRCSRELRVPVTIHHRPPHPLGGAPSFSTPDAARIIGGPRPRLTKTHAKTRSRALPRACPHAD